MNMMLMRPLLLAGGVLLLSACGGKPAAEAEPAVEAEPAADATGTAVALRAADASGATPPASDPSAVAVIRRPAAGGVEAPSAADGTVQSIERVLGDGAAYQRVFTALQQAVKAGDIGAVAALVRYPLRVSVDGKARTVPDAAAFSRDYAKIITADIAQVIQQQTFDSVMVNQQGVMLGDGQVWITGVCTDKSCSRQDVKVSTIQTAPSTP